MKPIFLTQQYSHVPVSAVGGRPGVATYLGNQGIETDTDSFTITNAQLGPAASDRVIVIGAGGQFSGHHISTVTVNAIPASFLVSLVTGPETAALYAAVVPAGTIGNIIVNLTGSAFRQNVFWWSCTGRNGSTTAYDTASSASGAEITIDVPESGVIFGYAQSASASGTGALWTTLIKDAEGDVGVSLNKASGAHIESQSAQSNLFVGCDLTPVVFASL